MKTNKTHRANGDIYYRGIKVYSGIRQSPVRWLECLIYAIGVPLIFLLLNILMEF